VNMISLILGIAAIVFAVHSLRVRGCLTCCTLSGFFCSAALLCQLMENDRIARLEDVSAMLDTAHARAVCAALLLGLCTALNLAALLRGRKQAGCRDC